MFNDVLFAGSGLRNIGWEPSDTIPYERVTLLLEGADVKALDEDKIYKAICKKGLGHMEWEVYSSRMIANAIKKADGNEADITEFFLYDLVAWDSSGKYTKTVTKLVEQLEKTLFDVVYEDSEELQLKFKASFLAQAA